MQNRLNLSKIEIVKAVPQGGFFLIPLHNDGQIRLKKNIREALMEAGETRFIPIILTTATTIGGLLPLTLAGGSLWAPMGWTIIGGLIASTMLTLLIVPVLYLLYSSKSQ